MNPFLGFFEDYKKLQILTNKKREAEAPLLKIIYFVLF